MAKYLLDENIPPTIGKALNELGIDTVHALDFLDQGADDTDIFALVFRPG